MNALSRIIAAEIQKNGPISFARFMDLALYCPDCGYYEQQPDNIGRRGDFHTSVSVGPMFGGLLAFQFDRWLETLAAAGDAPLHLVEAGAHDGTLASDVLTWLSGFGPEWFGRLEYFIIEPSSARTGWQRERLKSFVGRVKWVATLDELSKQIGGVSGVIFSNELLDAFPVRRFAWNRAEKRWFEWLVSGDESDFYSVSGPLLADAEVEAELGWVPADLEPHLPDGYVVEISSDAREWWSRAAATLREGWLMTVDYGFDDSCAVQPERTNGTLRAYRRHQVESDLLADPGEQDLTAHVNFSRIIEAGERGGLRTETFAEQGRFLSQVFQKAMDSPWAERFSTPENVRGFRTLIHPDHFGRLFHALVQRRV